MKNNVLPVIPWIGGKRRLAKHILPLFPEHSCYVEPFCGAAALFFMKEQSKVEVINDINGELINLYRVIQHHIEEFIRQFKWALSSRQVFEWAQRTDPSVLTDIQRAARFCCLQKQAFGGKVSGQTFGTATTTAPKFNIMRIEEDMSAAHFRLSRALIEHLSWKTCVEKYDRDHTLFYLDPPYWLTEGYGVDFEFDNYIRMAELAKTCKGKFVISVNDIPEMRRVFDGLIIESVSIKYTVGGAGRGYDSKSELLIRNF